MVASRPGAYLDAENEDQSISQESIRNEGRASFSTQDSLLMDSPLTDWCSFSASRCQPSAPPLSLRNSELSLETQSSTLRVLLSELKAIPGLIARAPLAVSLRDY